MTKITIKPIGKVISDIENPRDYIIACEKGLNTHTVSKIKVYKDFAKGLQGIEEFSHIFVIYFLDKVTKTELITHPGPPSIKDLVKVGIFASRSQYRPNPIALRLVKLTRVINNELHVQGLDAINNSPVLDIKPYIPGFDRPKEMKVANWYDWLNI